ncbi:MAG: TIGR04282 family arsenosugar biosynthesis glycosyltransferase [Verrucomicrobiota bacterium]
MKRAVLVFLKYPEPGKVKTRLGASLGEEESTKAYRQLVAKTFEQVRRANPEILAIAYDPPVRESEVKDWLAPYLETYPESVWWLPQREGDLGERLEGAVSECLAREGDLRLLVIGTDCIDLDQDLFGSAWKSLEDRDLVVGPSRDGGYYLIGMDRLHAELFQEIPWSCDQTLAATLEVAKRLGLKVATLPDRDDVDSIDEWNGVVEQVRSRRCVFFDRDGVVNRSPGPGYVTRSEEFHLNEGIAEALNWLRERNWLVILMTSQRGVGKGLMSRADLDEIHSNMQRELLRQGAGFDGLYAFTGEPDSTFSPKPDPDMILKASESFFIDLRLSWLIGDADRDIEMGKASQLAGTIRIRTEHPIRIQADYQLESTAEISDLLRKVL